MWSELNNPGGIMVGDEYKAYPTKEQGLQALETLLQSYVDEFGYDLKAIRNRYCGNHCGIEDLETFTQIYMEELKNE